MRTRRDNDYERGGGDDDSLQREWHAALAQCPVIGGKPVSFDGARAQGVPGMTHVVQVGDGVAVVADTHGRGWAPDFELNGVLRTLFSDAGYSTLSIQLPVLPGTAKIGDYLPMFPDSTERFALAAQWLHAQGFKKVAIISHSLGATMANQYLITTPEPAVDAWVFISIINGLEDMFRIKIPVLDVYGTLDWQVTRYGGEERRMQIARVLGSEQVVVQGAEHFFERQTDELTRVIAGFLGRVMK